LMPSADGELRTAQEFFDPRGGDLQIIHDV
jgi:hypothetical protein